MLKENHFILREAWVELSGRWWPVVGVFFVYLLILGGLQGGKEFGSLLSLILAGPLNLGAAIYTLSFIRKENPSIGQLFQGFNKFVTALAAYIVMVLIITVGIILFIVPGIIFALSYSLTFFILAENPEMRPMDALRKSRMMMDGHKTQLFYLSLRFLGLAILCLFTMGIGFIFLTPYVFVCMSLFYEDVKNNMPATV
jgi:uncharacterized membrane protein